MAYKKNFRNLTDDERIKLQEEDPEVIILPISEQQFAEGEAILRELQEESDKYPILKPIKESDELFACLMEMNNHRLHLIETLEYMPVTAAIQNWLIQLSESTRLKYAELMTDILERKIIPQFFVDGEPFTVGGLRHIRHEVVLEHIKKIPDFTEYAQQARIVCYVSFTAYLSKISYGWFRKALPMDGDGRSMLYRLRPKALKQALSLKQWSAFLTALDEINHRDSLIARCMLYGGFRVSQILELKINQLDVEKNIIRFLRSKKKNLEFANNYPAAFITELHEYVKETRDQRYDSDFIFVTRNGKPLTRSRLNYSFTHASAQAGIEKVTPELLRATWMLFKREDIVDDIILKVSKSKINEETNEINNDLDK
jgi:integrase/recombinase XerD